MRPVFCIFSRWNRGFQPFHRPSVHSVQTKRTRNTGATPPPNGEQNETKGTVHLKNRSQTLSETTGNCDENERVCNIFQLQLHRLFLLPTTVVNAPRRATEATEGITVPKYCKIRNGPFCGLFCRKDGNIGLLRGKVPKYCKIGEKGLFPAFSTGNAESSDFFDTKFRCFALKVRMFMLEKSDVFTLPNRIFHALFRNIRPKTRHFRTTDAEFAIRRDFLFDILTLQIMQISLAFRSGRDTEHCHENSRFSLFFSAPRRPFFI